jgi:hypothetical protein
MIFRSLNIIFLFLLISFSQFSFSDETSEVGDSNASSPSVAAGQTPPNLSQEYGCLASLNRTERNYLEELQSLIKNAKDTDTLDGLSSQVNQVLSDCNGTMGPASAKKVETAFFAALEQAKISKSTKDILSNPSTSACYQDLKTKSEALKSAVADAAPPGQPWTLDGAYSWAKQLGEAAVYTTGLGSLGVSSPLDKVSNVSIDLQSTISRCRTSLSSRTDLTNDEKASALQSMLDVSGDASNTVADAFNRDQSFQKISYGTLGASANLIAIADPAVTPAALTIDAMAFTDDTDTKAKIIPTQACSIAASLVNRFDSNSTESLLSSTIYDVGPKTLGTKASQFLSVNVCSVLSPYLPQSIGAGAVVATVPVVTSSANPAPAPPGPDADAVKGAIVPGPTQPPPNKDSQANDGDAKQSDNSDDRKHSDDNSTEIAMLMMNNNNSNNRNNYLSGNNNSGSNLFSLFPMAAEAAVNFGGMAANMLNPVQLPTTPAVGAAVGDFRNYNLSAPATTVSTGTLGSIAVKSSANPSIQATKAKAPIATPVTRSAASATEPVTEATVLKAKSKPTIIRNTEVPEQPEEAP